MASNNITTALYDCLDRRYQMLGFPSRTAAQYAFEELATYHYQCNLDSIGNGGHCADTFLYRYGHDVFPWFPDKQARR